MGNSLRHLRRMFLKDPPPARICQSVGIGLLLGMSKMIYIDTDLLVLAGYEDFYTFPPSWRVRCCLLRFMLIQNSKKRLSLVMFHHSSRRRDHHMRSHGNEAFTIDLDSNPNATVNSLIRGSFVPDFDFTSASHRWHSTSRGRTHRTICQGRYPFPLGQNPSCGRTLCEE